MERGINFYNFFNIAIFNMLADFYQQALHGFQLLIADAFGGKPCGQHFKAGTYFVNFVNVFNGNIGHIGAAARYHYHKAFQFQLADCFTHRRTADAHFISQLNFHKPFARAENAVNNRLADGFAYQFAQRPVAVKLNRA